jgi:ketosteroid isomerase-like protein
MKHDREIHEFLLRHLDSIQENDVDTYHATTADDLTLYEWWVTPHRIDGLPFHDFMMTENARRGTVLGAEGEPEAESARTRFDLANLHVQRYGDAAIASYTLLVSTGSPEGVRVAAHNETRVIVKVDGAWKVVHVHKSPAWPAPHVQPAPPA